MSEENEHTSEETEAEMNTANRSKEQSKSDTSMLNNQTEQPMLEDEEMPTYISVSSPSRREDSDVNNTKQQNRMPVEEEEHSRSPYQSDYQGAGSIYVLSSGEESNHPYNYEEEDEYADSDDFDEMDLENEHDNVMLEDEDVEDEDDEEEAARLRLRNYDDEDIDTEYEQECFDRASDDFVLNNRLRQHHKERSLSLQDLSFSKNNVHTPYNKKRHSLNIFKHNYLEMQQNPMVYSVPHKRLAVPVKYQHVESKVKQYIKEIKEQNRRSLEKRVKQQECAMSKNHEENKNSCTEKVKPRVTSKTIKDYAEKALKDLQEQENEDGNLTYNTTQSLENGGNKKISNTVFENQYNKHIRKDSNMQNEKHAKNCNDKLEKRNGSVDVNIHHIEYKNTFNKNRRFSNVNQSSLVNGHPQSPAFINLRSLSYEEYMSDLPNNEQKEELDEQRQHKANDTDLYNEADMISAQDIENSNTSCQLKIENVKSISVSQDELETSNFAKINSAERMNTENAELIQLKAQLSRKDAQFLNLRDAYQKTFIENIKIKHELDALKKSLAKYEAENKTCETKIASVQTDRVVEYTSKQAATTSDETNNKISTSSVASTASSTDHWADSAYSPAISIKPPDVTPILNSDDSLVLTNGVTPRKLPHPLSRTFITSSRILQTLSNITQGKTKVESPLVRNGKKRLNDNSTDHLLNLDCNSPIHASTSKKRKATEMLGTATSVQPFKIPHTTAGTERKDNSDASDVELKYAEEHVHSKVDKQDTSIDKHVDSVEAKVEKAVDQEDSVKCFIYRDAENSKNRSFLIQAEEPTKDRPEMDKNRIRECGPYLLGNLEVRMSEINGTISVWGKEINLEPTNDNEDDLETSTDRKSCNCWQNASQNRFNGSPLICSTNKKQKIPSKFNRPNISQCCQSLSLNLMQMPSMLSGLNDSQKHMDNNSFNASSRSCENWESAKYQKDCSACKGASTSQEKLHSCCIHHAEIADKECNCGSYHERQKCDVNPKCCKDKLYNKGTRRNSCKSSLDSKNHSHENYLNSTTEANDIICKHRTSCRRSITNLTEESPHLKCSSIVKDASCACKTPSENINHYDNSDRHTCKSLSHDGDEDPLLPPKRPNETAETRQRRLSGKRVRGILMDLLRGCGDCRSNNGADLNRTGNQKKNTLCTINGPPQIKISPASTNEHTCSSSMQCNDRCCHAYARRIESQLEEFRMEMERVRSRSDAILDMLNMLHSVDMN